MDWSTIFLCCSIYVIGMLLYRTLVESKTKVAAPSLKGWEAHRAEAKRVLEMFTNFLAKRQPGQLASLNRSRGGHSDSNRTVASDYKKTVQTVDVSCLDQPISLDRTRMLLHVEPGLAMDELARVSIAHGVVPQVVLEFPGITCGGTFLRFNMIF